MARRNPAKQLVAAIAAAIEYEQTDDEARAELVDAGVDVEAFLSRVHDVISAHTVTDVAPPKNTGGGGFAFEEEVCAWLMLCALAGEPPFDPELGLITRLDYQARADGWLPDDVVVTTCRGAAHHRIALSIKSNAQFTSSSAPDDFVLTAWQQWLHLDSGAFDRSNDYLGLVTGPVPDAPRSALSNLMSKVYVADASTFPARLATPGWANELERKLFQSFRPPSGLVQHVSRVDVETTAFAQRLRFESFDFGTPSCDSLKRALRLARQVTSAESAEALWESLCRIAKELRPKAGHITRAGLVDRLRGRFRLAEYPDHRSDWKRLTTFSGENLDSFSHLIAGNIPLPRSATVDQLKKRLASTETVAVTGRSGVGKSCVARLLVEQNDSRTLWFDARAFDNVAGSAFERGLGLQHSLRDLLAGAPDGSPVLVIDGLDRVFTDLGYSTAASLLRAAQQEAPATRWRILIPCQTNSWSEVSERLRRAGYDAACTVFEVDPVSLKELDPVKKAIPNISRLLLRPEVAKLMVNLKILDLVAERVRSGSDVDAGSWVGEANVAHWFWEAEIDRGSDRIPRARFARDLAQRQGDQLLASVPSDSFGAAELAAVKTLVSDNLCVQVSGDRLTFAHDLFGDWARLRLLLNQTDFPTYVRGRQSSPLWHRAIRLYGLYFLEQQRDLQKWRTVLASVDTDETRIVHDLLLDAPVFAVHPRPLLESILPTLLADDGRLLHRLLTRFLAFGTLPDTERIALARSLGIDDARARALFRYAHWPYWIGVIEFVHAHIEDIVPVCPVEVANMLEVWIPSVRKVDWAMRPAADIAIALGRQALDSKGYGDREWHQARQTMFRCMLAVASIKPDDVADIALRASSRRGIDFNAIKAAEAGENTSRSKAFDIVFRPEGLEDPWPDGPLQRVDEDFAEVVIEQHSLLPLLRARPKEAREVVLACLIDEPQRRKWHRDFHDRMELNLKDFDWQPPLYTNGPFLEFLQASFEDGLDVIVRMVDFATERMLSYEREEQETRHAHVQEQGDVPNESDADDISVEVGDERRTFKGDARAFGWSAGGFNPPETIQAALMALERYFYLEIEAGRDVEEKTLAVLRKGSSTALLRVLIDVGKKLQSLFMTSLRGLLGIPELYEWDAHMAAQGRSWALFGAFDKGQAFIDEARAFHSLEHRNVTLGTLAPWLLFRSPAMTEFFANAVTSWSTIDADDSSMTADLCVLLAPANWEDDMDAHGRQIKINRKYVERQKVRALARTEDQVVTARLVLPAQCRMILDNDKTLSEVELESLWKTWLELWQAEQDEHRKAEEVRSLEAAGNEEENLDRESALAGIPTFSDAVLGGVAVFLKHRQWIDRHPERFRACRDALEHVIEHPPARRMFDRSDSVSTFTWVCFAADILVMLFARNNADRNVRRWLAEAVFAPQYAAVAVLFKRAAEMRDVLGPDFEQLRRLALDWSYVRPRAEFLAELENNARSGGRFPTPGFDDNARRKAFEVLEKWVRARVAAFEEGKVGEFLWI